MEINNKSFDYNDILASFGERKIEERYSTLYEYLETFIKRHNYESKVVIANSVLNQAIIDYFVDIFRLKSFHQIEIANHIKIHAYTAYWILRRKPLQIIQDDVNDVNLAFVNEKFVASYLIQFTRGEYDKVIILEDERQAYFEFAKNLEYFLRYRYVTPQMIETMLEAYMAGKAFQKSLDYSQ